MPALASEALRDLVHGPVVTPDSPDYDRSRALMAGEANARCRGC